MRATTQCDRLRANQPLPRLFISLSWGHPSKRKSPSRKQPGCFVFVDSTTEQKKTLASVDLISPCLSYLQSARIIERDDPLQAATGMWAHISSIRVIRFRPRLSNSRRRRVGCVRMSPRSSVRLDRMYIDFVMA